MSTAYASDLSWATGGATSNGTPAELWTCNDSANQRWTRS